MSKFRPSQEEPEPTQLMPQKNTWLTKSELIVGYLQQMALPSMWPRELTTDDYALWDHVLQGYSSPAIRFGFDNWIHGGKSFPKPADIEPLCISWQEQQEIAHKPRDMRGRLDGGHVQVMALWKRVNARVQEFTKANKVYEPLTDAEIDQLMREVQ